MQTMANFTIELRTLLQTDFQIALDTYPIWDEAYRAVLNKKIIDHYYFCEIGLETPDMWNHYLAARMNEIMPYYNKVYAAQNKIIDPITNYKLDETQQRNQTGNTQGDTTSTDSNRTTLTKGNVITKAARSDTPQGNLDIMSLEAGGYASEVNITDQQFPGDDINQLDGSGQTQTQQQMTNTEDFARHLTGYQNVSPGKLLSEYIDSIQRIDGMIIKDLGTLFMQVYS